MNGLTLRISPGGGGKSKKSIGYAPVIIPAAILENAGNSNLQLRAFINSTSTDEQLVILKKILDINKDSVDAFVIKFMVATFFLADAKHPIKCFLSRHITKNKHLEQPFINGLASHISEHISSPPTDLNQYITIVSKIALCIENFNAGVAAVRMIEVTLAGYLKNCLECCIKMLREKEALSPTEKNEIFNLIHLSLRLLLHIMQKANTDNISKLTPMFEDIRLFIQDLTVDDDVPMDTKSVSGILYLTMHVIENGDDSWTCILNPDSTNIALNKLLTLEAARLSLYSAIATVVSADNLFSHIVEDGPAIVILTKKILDIGDRSSSESAFILGVTRTLLQISKLLDKMTDRSTGLTLVDLLLMFAWSHLEHYMDSVRHLTGQILGCVVKYCAKMDRAGDGTALEKLTTAVQALDRSRKSFYLSVTWLAPELGARALLHAQRRPHLRLRHLLHALHLDPIQATVRCALESLLVQYCAECSSEQVWREWGRGVLRLVREAPAPVPGASAPESSPAPAAATAPVLAHAQALLVRACHLQPDLITYIVPYIKEATSCVVEEEGDIKCILMLQRVARQARGAAPAARRLLRRAATCADDETRILALSLVVESPKSTEEFTEDDLQLVLYYLKYNINAQSPNFRQLTLSVMKKFINRFEDSYKVIKREKQRNGVNDKVVYYLRFVEQLRRQCFDSLLPGANYSRRFVALQILAWCEQITLEGYEREWEPAYVEKLLLHLEDSYENNKAFALEVLEKCPIDLLKGKKYSISLDIENIFRQASSLKPTDCVSAGYKLDLLRRCLPDYILENEDCVPADVERVCWRLARRLLAALGGAWAAAGPPYGLLHCVRAALADLDPLAISSDEHWTSLIGEIIDTCMEVNAAVAPVVNNSSPEGHLPMDMTVLVTDYGNTGNVTLEDGRQVTAQMVLLCAWRSVKEVSLLLGDICSRFTISGEGQASGTLSVEQVVRMGEHFTALLAETKHRGAFEQAYVGFTKLLARLWRCGSGRLHGLPRGWLGGLMRALDGAAAPELCSTRRSAGLPFMIQALVTTELQVEGNPRCFHSCMSALVRLAARGAGAARLHARNILRALVRCAALHDAAAPHVGSALLAALGGFGGDSWAVSSFPNTIVSSTFFGQCSKIFDRETGNLLLKDWLA